MPERAARSLSPRALALLALLTLVWGSNWPLFPIVLKAMSVWEFRVLSLCGGGAVLLAWARARGLSLVVPRADWPMVLGASLSYLAVWNLASAYATTLIPSGQTAVLGFTMPLWLALMAWAFLGQRLTPRLLLALTLGGAAVALLMSASFKAYAQAPLGMALGLLAGIGWAAGTLLLKRFPVALPAVVFTGWQLLTTGLVVGLVGWALGLMGGSAAGGAAARPSFGVWALVVYITLVPMALGNLTWFKLVELLPAQVAGLSSVMVPVVAMLAGAWVHGEPLGLTQWLAMACSAAALWLTLRR